jgi:hypothetical protein
MRLFSIFLALVLIIGMAGAALYPGKINTGSTLQTDVKGATNGEALVAIQTIGSAGVGPEASDDDQLLLAGNTTNTTSWRNRTAFSAQPDYCRTILLTPSKTTNGTAVIVGTDMAGAALTQSHTWTSSGAAYTSTYAFKTVTKLAFHNFTSGTTFKAGTADQLGLNTKRGFNDVLYTLLNGVLEGTPATVTTSSTILASNTIDLNSAYSNTSPVSVYYLVTA